jgi:dipeptidyl aminopeptidase/acylaminoacyl peptidase
MNHIGDRIAYLARKESEIELCVDDLHGNNLVKFPVKTSRNLFDFVWARTGKHILVPQDKDGDENDHIICFDVENGTSRDLTPFAGAKSIVKKLSKKYPNEVIIICNKDDPKWFDVYRVNIITGESRLVFKNTSYNPNFVFDDNLTLRLASKTQPNGSDTIYLMDGKTPTIFKKIPFEDTKNTEYIIFNSDGKIVYGVDSIGRDKGALIACDVRRKTSKILFESDEADVETFGVDPITFAPQWVAIDYLKPETFVIDETLAADMRYLNEHLQGKKLDIVSRSEDDSTWLVRFFSSNTPMEYFIYKRNACKSKPRALIFLFSTQPSLNKYQLQEKIPVIIKSRDGLDLVCYLTKSVDYTSKASQRKLLIKVHGGPWMRDKWCFEKEVQLWANRGYSVLQINYRGSTGFGKDFINAANRSLDKIRNDIIDVVNWAIEKGIADQHHIAIIGGSFGGYSTLAGLTSTPDIFCCGIAVAGISNWKTLLDSAPPYWIPQIAELYKLLGDPKTEDGRKMLQEFSPLTYVDNIKRPLLMFQGANDPRVNKRESDQIAKKMKEKGLQVVYVIYPDEGHGCVREQNQKSMIAIEERFLSRVLGGRAEPERPGELTESSHQIIYGREIID